MRSRSNGADSVRTLSEENKENIGMEGVIQLRSALPLMSSTGSYSSSRTPFTFAHHDWDRTHLVNVNVTNKAYHMFLLVSMATLYCLTVIYQQRVSLGLSALILPKFYVFRRPQYCNPLDLSGGKSSCRV